MRTMIRRLLAGYPLLCVSRTKAKIALPAVVCMRGREGELPTFASKNSGPLLDVVLLDRVSSARRCASRPSPASGCSTDARSSRPRPARLLTAWWLISTITSPSRKARLVRGGVLRHIRDDGPAHGTFRARSTGGAHSASRSATATPTSASWPLPVPASGRPLPLAYSCPGWLFTVTSRVLRLPLADHLHRHLRAGRGLGDLELELRRVADRLAVVRLHHVAALDDHPCRPARPRSTSDHQRPRDLVEAEFLGQRRRQRRLEADAQDSRDRRVQTSRGSSSPTGRGSRGWRNRCPGCRRVRLRIAVLMPTRRPSTSTSAPPLLPGLMAASVWMKSSSVALPVTRSLPLTMPCVTLCVMPKGLPTASTMSPTASSSLSAKVIAGRSLALILMTATSVFSSAPMSLAENSRPSARGHADFARSVDHVTVGQDIAVGRNDDARAQPVLARSERILVARRSPTPLLLTEEPLEQVRLVVSGAAGCAPPLEVTNTSTTLGADFLHDRRETTRRGTAAVHRRMLDFHLRLSRTRRVSASWRRVRQRERGTRRRWPRPPGSPPRRRPA